MSSKDLIIAFPNDHLRTRSKRVNVVTDDIKKIIADMKRATLDWEAGRPHELGVALAAIQIDQPVRIIIIRNNFDDKKDQSFSVFINPEITKYEGDVEDDFEGCLSVTDVYGKVTRHCKVRVRALDETGRELRIRAEGFLARVFQHEIDHINGKAFIDHIQASDEAFYKLTSEGKLEKLDYESVKKTGILRD